MSATADPSAAAVEVPTYAPLSRADGIELLGPVHGCGYRDGACLVRRGDGQMVQLGRLMYGLLECVDGQRTPDQLADALSEQLGRRVDQPAVDKLAQKLASQGLLAGTEHQAPPRRNPLLALRWKVLVTNPKWTQRLTAPFTFLFRPWIMWPILAAFAGVFWFVLVHKGVASATADAFNSPGLLLLVFVLAVASAGLHELGHAAACRYGGATPGGMGMGLYLVWPAFYTDVTDTYRLPRRDRLRVDLAGLYFNAAVAVLTMAVWLVVRADALLLLVALQVLQMIKQLSPVIRADGYHILADATGVPDLYSHMGPTLRRLIPGRHSEPSALTGRARLIVTLWVLIVVPVLLSLMLGAIILLPRLATSAWDSGRHLALAISHDASAGQILPLLASLVRLLAVCLPVLGSVLVTQKIIRSTAARAQSWSRGRPERRVLVMVAAAGAVAAMVWGWWPSGQYQPVRANQNGTLGGLVQLVSAPAAVARPAPAAPSVTLSPGKHLAVSMIPVGGATPRHPALFIISGGRNRPPVAIISPRTPDPSKASGGSLGPSPSQGGTSTAGTTTSASSSGTAAAQSTAPSTPVSATAFPFKLPPMKPGDNRAVAVGTHTGGVTYDVAYSLVTVTGGAPVTERNSAYALADCSHCTTVAVSFQVVLVVGQDKNIAPINEAEALNQNCTACTTAALADQIVVTLKSQPSAQLMRELEFDLRRLNALASLGTAGAPAAIAAAVNAVQQQIDAQLNQSGLLAKPITTSTSGGTGAGGATSSAGASSTSQGTTGSTGGVASSSTSTTSTAPTAPAASSPSASSSTTSTTASGTMTTSTSQTATSPESASSTTTPAG